MYEELGLEGKTKDGTQGEQTSQSMLHNLDVSKRLVFLAVLDMMFSQELRCSY